MKKHKRDYSGSMESARSAAGSWCSQSRPQKGFIDSPERLWNETLYCYGIITVCYFFFYVLIAAAANIVTDCQRGRGISFVFFLGDRVFDAIL